MDNRDSKTHYVPEDENPAGKRGTFGGMRTSMTDLDGLHEYGYDTLYQFLSATHPTVTNPLEQFQYDAAGNRLTDATHSAYQHNELNQLLEDDSAAYEYDLDGNMTLKFSKATGDSTEFFWDIENRLVRIEKTGPSTPLGVTAEYVYGPLGRRLAKVVNGVRTEFRYDGEDLILTMNDVGAVTGSWTFGPGIDQPLAMNRGGVLHYYLADGPGSVRALADEAGAVAQTYEYSVFGEITAQAGGIDNPFTYTAREWEPEVGLYQYRERWYDAVVGKFMTAGPAGRRSDLNLLRYVHNSPTNLIDPFGLEETEFGIDPFSEDHTHRNRYNRCPSKPPTKAPADDPCGGKQKGHHYDHLGNEWKPDNPVSAAIFHGGLHGLKSYRGQGTFAGSQCTYNENGILVDYGPYMGTYDYGPPGTKYHVELDVKPHNVNPNYQGGLTETY